MKKLLSLILVLTLAISLFSCRDLSADSKGDDDSTDNQYGNQTDKPGGDKATPGDAVALVTVDINPSIEITLDEKGVVATVYGANEDGQILLYGEAEALVGMSYEDAVAYITDLAVKLDYLDAETGKINTSVIADDLEFAKEVQSKLGDKIKAEATENGITVDIDTSDPFSLLCELEELKTKYPDRTDIQNLTLTKYKLALTLSEREDISIVAAIEYDSSEMIEKISAAHSTLETYATDAYLAAKREATGIFEKSMGIVIAGAYNDVYMKNLVKHPGTFYYGAAYQAYSTTALTYRYIYEIKAFGDSMVDYEPDAAAIEAIKTELGLSDTAVLENEEGKVTLDSLIDFCDEFLATHEVSEDVKSEIRDIVADAKVAAELADKATAEMYKKDMENLKAQIGTVITTINTTYNTICGNPLTQYVITDEQKTDIENCLADLELVEAKVEEIMTGGVTLSEVDALATEAEELADEILAKIKLDLSADELAEAETKIENLKSLQSQLTADFEARLSAAEAEAKRFIENEREKREKGENAN